MTNMKTSKSLTSAAKAQLADMQKTMRSLKSHVTTAQDGIKADLPLTGELMGTIRRLSERLTRASHEFNAYMNAAETATRAERDA